MTDKALIAQLTEEAIAGTDLFVVEIKVSTSNRILVYLDGDQGVPISSCIKVSRHIESHLDREVEDFELEVSSVGLDKPLVMPRQFRKNIGREVQWMDMEGKKHKAVLLDADALTMTVQPEKSKKKKSAEPDTPIQWAYDQIKEVKVLPSFKSENI